MSTPSDVDYILRALDRVEKGLSKLTTRIDNMEKDRLQDRINSYTPEQAQREQFKGLFEVPVDVKAGWPYSEADKRRRIALADVDKQITWHETQKSPYYRMTFVQAFMIEKQLADNAVPEPCDITKEAWMPGRVLQKRDLDLLAQWNEYGWYHSLTTRLRRMCE